MKQFERQEKLLYQFSEEKVQLAQHALELITNHQKDLDQVSTEQHHHRLLGKSAEQPSRLCLAVDFTRMLCTSCRLLCTTFLIHFMASYFRAVWQWLHA